MNRFVTALGSLALVGSLSACGALRATESVPDKMEGMNAEVRRTNDGMQTMIDQVRQTNEGITNTNLAVHNQTLAVALSEMMKSENTQILFPPMGMLPAGQVFANEATADEIVRLVYVLLKDIDSSLPNDSERDPATGDWRPETKRRIDHEKLAKFTAAMVISGLAPQTKIDEIRTIQIDAGGRFEQTAYAVLMLRYSFVSDFLLQESLFSTPLANPGQIAEAVRLADQLTSISSLPYPSLIAVRTRGMLDPADNVELTLNVNQTTTVWRRILRAFEDDLQPRYRSPSAAAAEQLRALREHVQAQIPANACLTTDCL